MPEVVITNDWFCAFTAGYARDQTHFGTIFENTSFMHIFHNLDVNYEGRFYTSKGETLEKIHCLPNDWLIDPYWADHIINPSRLALIASDQWTTVSKSYLEEIRYGSPLSPLLNKFPEPFACSNGVSVKDRLKELANELKKRNLKHMDHLDAKKFLMNKYLKTPELDRDLCIFSFVGRITEQKGVDMICSVVEEQITKHDYKVAFIIGGPATKGDPHGDMVTSACEYLLKKFPNNFYANTSAFFYDVPVLCLGSNFCLMPSRFEPGGIVQHEFFVASTPAVVFATGGLKDSVTEYNFRTGKGNGFEFMFYDRGDLIYALDRAYSAFKNKEAYRRLRKNAFESVIDVANVSKEWCSEIYRIRGKVFVDKVKYDQDLEEIKKEESDTASKDSDDDGLSEVDFKYCGKSTDQVYVAGSFNNWNDKEIRMGYNHQIKEFHCNVKLKPGKHYFKIKVNGKWRLDHHRKVSTDENGDEVNVLELK